MKYGELTPGQTEALVNRLGGMDVVKGILSNELMVTVVNAVAKLLWYVATVKIPATSRFVTKDHFTTSNKEMKIAYLGDNFQRHFLSKVEESQAETELR